MCARVCERARDRVRGRGGCERKCGGLETQAPPQRLGGRGDRKTLGLSQTERCLKEGPRPLLGASQSQRGTGGGPGTRGGPFPSACFHSPPARVLGGVRRPERGEAAARCVPTVRPEGRPRARWVDCRSLQGLRAGPPSSLARVKLEIRGRVPNIPNTKFS